MDKPDDPKPSKPPEAGTAGPPKPTPPPLRARMFAEAEDQERNQSQAVQNVVGIVMLAAVVVLGIALVVMVRKGQEAAKREAAEEARLVAEQARADSLRNAFEDSLRVARADSLAKVAPKKPPTPPAGALAEGAVEPPPEPTHFGISIGTFMTDEGANQEHTKVQGTSGLAGRVTPVTQDGVTQYRVVMGDFTDRGEADKRASDLVAAAAVREALVIKLPKN